MSNVSYHSMLLIQLLRKRAQGLIDFLKSPLGAFLLTVVGLVLGVYATWYNDKKTEVSVAELLSSDVLTEHASIPSLEVTFQGRTLDPSKTPLKVSLVKLWNSGDTTIRQPDYDPQAPVGFRVENGSILWIAVEQASGEYLRSNTRPRVTESNAVSFPPLILEPKDFVVVKLMTLQSQAGKLSIKPFGKVAGAADITERITAWHPAGYIEAFRTPSEDRFRRYMIGLLFGLILLNLIVVLVNDWRAKLRARQASKQSADPQK